MSPEEEVQRGEHAKRLLEDPLLVEAFDLIEQEITDKWKTSPARDEEGREKLYLSVSLLQNLKSKLHHVVQTGQVAEKSLAQKLGLKR